ALACLAVLVLSWAGGGCQTKPSAPQLVSVQGRLIYRSKPVPSARVEFIPEDNSGGIAGAWTGPDRSFTLRSHPHRDGAMPGRYRVRVSLYPGATGIPDIYADESRTPLRIDVPESGLPNCVLTLRDR